MFFNVLQLHFLQNGNATAARVQLIDYGKVMTIPLGEVQARIRAPPCETPIMSPPLVVKMKMAYCCNSIA